MQSIRCHHVCRNHDCRNQKSESIRSVHSIVGVFVSIYKQKLQMASANEFNGKHFLIELWKTIYIYIYIFAGAKSLR